MLLALVLVNYFLNSDGNSPPAPLEFNPVASAAKKLEGDMGGRMSLYVVYTSPALPGPLEANGSGAYNGKTERSRITLNLDNPITGRPEQSVQISDGEFEYEGGSLIAGELPPGKKWVRTTEDASKEDETELSFEESLEMLGSSASTTLIGRESINGKMTRHYSSEIQISDAVEFLREKGQDTKADAYEQIQGVVATPIRAEGWVDDKNLLRRMRMVMPMPGDPGDPPMAIDMGMDFFAFGAEPNIQLPDPASVVDGPLEDDDGEDAAPTSLS